MPHIFANNLLGHVSKNVWTMYCSQIAARNIWNISFRTCLSPKKNETSLRAFLPETCRSHFLGIMSQKTDKRRFCKFLFQETLHGRSRRHVWQGLFGRHLPGTLADCGLRDMSQKGFGQKMRSIKFFEPI